MNATFLMFFYRHVVGRVVAHIVSQSSLVTRVCESGRKSGGRWSTCDIYIFEGDAGVFPFGNDG